MLFDKVAIEAVACLMAPHRISSESLEAQIAPTLQRLRIPPGRLQALSGIRERRFWDTGTLPSAGATAAARAVLEQADVDPQRIGCLISTSVCKDCIEPSMASLVHGDLGLAPHCANFDIGSACLGFIQGMGFVAQQIEAGLIDYGLVVDSEGSQEVVAATLARLQHEGATAQDFRDHFATLTLGSGAVAMLLCHKRLARTPHSLNGLVTLAATQHNRLCVGHADRMLTDPAALLIAGVKLVVQTWQLAAAELPRWQDSQLAAYIPHQVSARHMAAVAEALHIPEAKLCLNFQTLGNIGPAAVPITLAMAAESGAVKPGDHIGLLAIGSGLNCAMVSVDW